METSRSARCFRPMAAARLFRKDGQKYTIMVYYICYDRMFADCGQDVLDKSGTPVVARCESHLGI